VLGGETKLGGGGKYYTTTLLYARPLEDEKKGMLTFTGNQQRKGRPRMRGAQALNIGG